MVPLGQYLTDFIFTRPVFKFISIAFPLAKPIMKSRGNELKSCKTLQLVIQITAGQIYEEGIVYLPIYRTGGHVNLCYTCIKHLIG